MITIRMIGFFILDAFMIVALCIAFAVLCIAAFAIVGVWNLHEYLGELRADAGP